MAARTRARSSAGEIGAAKRRGSRSAALVVAERLAVPQPELAREERVVADLRMRVERQVVGGEVDVVLEQRAQALGQQRRQPGRVELPEQAVVDEHELGAELDRALDQLPPRADARDHRVISRAPGPGGRWAPVVELAGIQQLVEGRDDVGYLRHGV